MHFYLRVSALALTTLMLASCHKAQDKAPASTAPGSADQSLDQPGPKADTAPTASQSARDSADSTTAPGVAASMRIRSDVRDFAENWRAQMSDQGKAYRTAVGLATVVGKPGQSNYVAAFDLALKSAILDANTQYVGELANNEIQKVVQKYTLDRSGVSPADAEAICQEANAGNYSAKLKEVANALANRAIQKLGGDVDHSSDFDTALRCRYLLMANRVSTAERSATQMAIRGGRQIRVETENSDSGVGSVAVAMAYGVQGLAIADTVKAQRPPASPNPHARSEIEAWVKSNVLNADEILTVIGVRAFKLTNGEFALVSVGLADLPSQSGQMSETEMRFRAQNAYPMADTKALGQIEEFVGASISDEKSSLSEQDESISLDTEIKDGVATATTETQAVRTQMQETTAAISRGHLRGVITVSDGIAVSKQAGESVAYVVRGWSPSLLAFAQSDLSENRKDHSVEESDDRTSHPDSKKTPKKSQSPDMKEDF